jgi:hypothetical protein
VAAARYDHVRVAFTRLDELEMHRLHGRQVLVDDLVERPSAITRIALQTPDQSNVRICVDEYFHVAKFADAIVDEEQDAVDDNHVSRLDADGLRLPQVSHEIVLRFIDCSPVAERLEMIAEQIVVKSIGMIPIELASLVER